MIGIENKVSFVRVFQVMKSIDSTSGAFLLRESSKRKSLKEYVFKLTIPIVLFSYTFLMISTLYVTDFELISIILLFSVGSTVYGIAASLAILMFNSDIVKNLLKWCESIYDIEKKYPKVIYTVAETKLMTVETQSIKFLTLFRRIFYIDGICFTLGIAFISIFMPEHIYPKYSPPIPFFLPFKNQKSWLAFVCTTLIEAIITVETASMGLYVFGLIICLSIHILGYMDIILQIIGKLKQDITITKFDGQPTSMNHSTLDLEILASVDAASLMKSQNNPLSFDEYLKILTDMISDVNSVLLSAAKLYALPILLTELSGLGSLFVSGLIIIVLQEKYSFAFGITLICGLLFMVCVINEKILEQFENIHKALYDVPWYNLSPKQRKSFMILMHHHKIVKGFSSAGIHNASYERFGLIFKAGYTYLLVLKDLVQA